MSKHPKFKAPPEFGKRPSFSQPIDVSKRPKAASDGDDFYRLSPSWRVSLVRMLDPYGWQAVREDKLKQIRNKLADFESMTWGEILIHAKKQNHLVGVNQICAEARKCLEEIKQGDVDQLVSLHLTGRERILGIPAFPALKILWWDPNHEICPAPKKHT